MATIAEFKRRFDRFYGTDGGSLKKTIKDEVTKHSEVILDLNRDQLLYGRDAEGRVLTPTYYDDPYFKTKEQARAYVSNKVRLSHQHKSMISYSYVQLFPEKDVITPNLIVTGEKFFNHFFIKISDNSYSIGSVGEVAPDIENKYGEVYGLAPQSRSHFYYRWLRPAIWQWLINNIGNR